MNRDELYESLVKEVKGNLNFKQIQVLKTLKKENEPLIEEKIHKLKKGEKINEILFHSILGLMVILAFILQTDFLQNYHHFIIILLAFLPISLSSGFRSMKNSIANLNILRTLLMLTKNDDEVK